MTQTYYAPAKVNLWLRVFQRDATGFHQLDTLFCAIDLCDRIELTKARPGIQLHVHGAHLGPTENNLAYRAAVEYYNATGLTPSVEITMHKTIPAGAGLGGGSSDAATVLRALQDLHEHVLPEQDLLALAARLGSDVPFFLCGSHLAHARGRGEILSALPPLPARDVLVIMPAFAISTRAAYEWLDDSGKLMDATVRDVRVDNWHDVEKTAANDFENVLFAKFPQLLQLRDALRHSGASIALVSGSGSALFAVFPESGQDATVRADLARRFDDVAIYTARTME